MARVRFGDVVKEIKINIDRATNTHEFYIAGEHMESENVHLTKRGCFEGSDVGPAFIRLFRPGQVLYGSRRTYLKKVAVADFEGITSNTTFVLETKDESVLLQSLLPFIMLTDSFTEHAVKNSKGSTNPYILFSDLCSYEFELPPIETQHVLSAQLWAFDRAKEAYKRLLRATDDLVQSQFIEMFKGGQYPVVKAQDVCQFITKGTTPKSDEIYTQPSANTVPYLKVYNLSFDGSMLFFEEPQYIDRSVHDGKLARSKVYPNDVLMNIVGPPLGKFALVNDDFEEWNINQAIAIFRAKESILPRFLLHALMQPDVLGPFLEKAQGVRQLNFSLEQCRNLEFPLPSIVEQAAFVRFVEHADKSKFCCSVAEKMLIVASKATFSA